MIDDDAAARAALTRLLTQSGYDVRTAADGSEGLRSMAEFLPEVLLVDIFMSGQDGLKGLLVERKKETLRRGWSAVPPYIGQDSIR